ncbi:unnamed protein product, partial [Nesidiocoris tenuis]
MTKDILKEPPARMRSSKPPLAQLDPSPTTANMSPTWSKISTTEHSSQKGAYHFTL